MIIMNYGTKDSIRSYRVNGTMQELQKIIDDYNSSEEHAIVHHELTDTWKQKSLFIKVLHKTPISTK